MQPNAPTPHPLRRVLLIAEFGALAVLLGSMAWFSSHTADGGTLQAAWLLIPAVASLVVFLSFIGLMYLRWVAAANDANRVRHTLIFALLALTLIGVWLYGIGKTWLSMQAG
ncbi:hypothetical protein LPB19_05420 [Marinobacter salinisoli]|uniref:Uncharacterized protein n=1 Tax=Marinobacter salinisoli TaxID=2769486 RepID=A0ABX7MXK7_9GAMM|nr:hypothetical protein [Marinobacter salinisoli]QSP95846.1 hypothetical protein LPB19_05420 [Marinobacter salinisoli]